MRCPRERLKEGTLKVSLSIQAGKNEEKGHRGRVGSNPGLMHSPPERRKFQRGGSGAMKSSVN